MDDIEKQAFLYSFIEYSNQAKGTGPKEILRPVITRGIHSLGKTTFRLEEVHSAILSDFGKSIDLIIIRSELSKMQAAEILSYDRPSQKYILLDSSKDYSTEYDASTKAKDNFVRCLKGYCDSDGNHSSGLTFKQLLEALTIYVRNHLIDIVSMLETKRPVTSQRVDDAVSIELEKFIVTIVLRDPVLLQAFEQIYNGIVLLYVYENCPIFFDNEKKLGTKVFFLDSNIVLRVLGLQDEVINTIGAEFFTYLKDHSFQISITGYTWEEIRNLLVGYSYNHNKFFQGGMVSHVYQVMRNRGVDPDEIGDFIDNVKDRLNGLSIEIDERFALKSEDFYDLDARMRELAKLKHDHKCELQGEVFNPERDVPDLYLRQAKHDLLNIYNIKGLRNSHSQRTFEKEKYYFVTADYQLRQYVKASFRSDGQPYTIGDGALAFLLYYRNPANSKGLSVQSFINAHFDSKALSIRNWYVYFEHVKAKFKSGELTKEQVGYLLNKVVFDNEKFATTGVDTIIDEAVHEFEGFVKKVRETETENSELRNKKSALEEVVDQLSNSVDEKMTRLEEMQTKVIMTQEENLTLSLSLRKQEADIKNMESRQKWMIAGLICLSLALFLFNNAILGSISSLLTVVLGILEVNARLGKK